MAVYRLAREFKSKRASEPSLESLANVPSSDYTSAVHYDFEQEQQGQKGLQQKRQHEKREKRLRKERQRAHNSGYDNDPSSSSSASSLPKTPRRKKPRPKISKDKTTPPTSKSRKKSISSRERPTRAVKRTGSSTNISSSPSPHKAISSNQSSDSAQPTTSGVSRAQATYGGSDMLYSSSTDDQVGYPINRDATLPYSPGRDERQQSAPSRKVSRRSDATLKKSSVPSNQPSHSRAAREDQSKMYSPLEYSPGTSRGDLTTGGSKYQRFPLNRMTSPIANRPVTSSTTAYQSPYGTPPINIISPSKSSLLEMERGFVWSQKSADHSPRLGSSPPTQSQGRTLTELSKIAHPSSYNSRSRSPSDQAVSRSSRNLRERQSMPSGKQGVPRSSSSQTKSRSAGPIQAKAKFATTEKNHSRSNRPTYRRHRPSRTKSPQRCRKCNKLMTYPSLVTQHIGFTGSVLGFWPFEPVVNMLGSLLERLLPASLLNGLQTLFHVANIVTYRLLSLGLISTFVSCFKEEIINHILRNYGDSIEKLETRNG